MVATLKCLGWLINDKKNFPEPTHVLEILGLVVNSHEMTISAPSKKIKKLKKMALSLLETGTSTPRELAKFLGFLGSLSQALLPERLWSRVLHINKNRALSSGANWDSPIKLSIEACLDLTFWFQMVKQYNGKSWLTKAKIQSESDASILGFGATCEDLILFDQWSPEEALRHSTTLEMDAAARAIKHFILVRQASNTTWFHKSDNTTVVSVHKQARGQEVSLERPCRGIFGSCVWSGTYELSSIHIPGKENNECDRLSRLASHKTEWRLNPEVFQLIDQQWGPHLVDLFAARENSQLPRGIFHFIQTL